MKRFVLVLAVIGLLAPVAGRCGDYSFELTIRNRDDPRPFNFKRSMTRAELDDLQRDGDRGVLPYVNEAKRAYAKRKGYTEEIYGPDYWKMVQVENWDYRVMDPDSHRAVATGGKNKVGQAFGASGF